MSNKFLFIAPPYERLKGLTLESIPLGILSLATVLTEAGFPAKVFDSDSAFEIVGDLDYDPKSRAESHEDYLSKLDDENHIVWRELRHLLEQEKPDFIGVAMMTPVYSSSQRVVKIVKEVLPNATIVAGGPHVTLTKEKALETLPEVEVGFLGEAEESVVEFVKKYSAGENWKEMKGILYHQDGKIVNTGTRDPIKDLDALPFPDRTLLVNASRYQKSTIGTMIAARGCPYACTFCASVPLWGRKTRFRSAESMFAEVNYLVDNYNISTFGFWDDTFTIKKKSVIEFCKLVYKKYGSYRFTWNCLTNVNCLNDEVLYWLKKSGCKQIEIGVESGSDRVLKKLKKGINTDRVRKMSKLIKKHGLWLHTFFMVGLPYETEEDIRMTIDFIKEIEPHSMNLCTFTPHPGTELHDYVVQKKMLDANNLAIYEQIGHHSTNNYFMEEVSREKYLELLNELMNLATNMSNKMTPFKFWVSLRRTNWTRLKRRIKRVLKGQPVFG